MIIAIDGPSASGKSTVARRVAVLLGCLHVDSGALYRAITWKALAAGIDIARAQDLLRHIDGCKFLFSAQDGSIRFTIDGIDPAPFLRSESVHDHVSDVAAIPEIRKRVVRWLQDMSTFGDLVMEGRDIGSVVFPDTGFKFYLDADPAERARRRYSELAGNRKANPEEVRRSLETRDRKDSGRGADPLRVPRGAVCLDTTHNSIDEVAGLIVRTVKGARQTTTK